MKTQGSDVSESLWITVIAGVFQTWHLYLTLSVYFLRIYSIQESDISESKWITLIASVFQTWHLYLTLSVYFLRIYSIELSWYFSHIPSDTLRQHWKIPRPKWFSTQTLCQYCRYYHQGNLYKLMKNKMDSIGGRKGDNLRQLSSSLSSLQSNCLLQTNCLGIHCCLLWHKNSSVLQTTAAKKNNFKILLMMQIIVNI